MSDVLDEEGLQRELRWLYEYSNLPIAVDTETTGLRVGGDSIAIGVSLAAVQAGHASSIYIPINHQAGTSVGERTLSMLRHVLEVQPRKLIFANVQFDVLALESIGILTDHQDFEDVIVMAHLLDENMPISKSLDSLAKHYLGVEVGKVDDKFINAQKKIGWPDTTYEQMWPYATTDTELTWRVHQELLKRGWSDLPAWIWPHKQALVRTLLQMRRRGVLIDTALAESQVSASSLSMVEAKAKMGLAAEDTLGPKALERIIHDDLGIPVEHRTATGAPCFNKVAMDTYDDLLERAESPVGRALKEYRGWQKASTAAYSPYLRLMDSDGRLRCGYKLHGTTTGRLSCSEPNLQQIPKESDKAWNGRVKECFVAAPGYTLVNADFSQLELRLATTYAPDPKLVQVFAEGRDIFTEMSQQLGMSRQDTKTLVYSMQYGAGKNRLMTAFHVDEARAMAIRGNYNATYPLFAVLNRKCTTMAEERGYIQMWSGRRRRFKYSSESYKAMNAMIQGGAADIVERIMVRMFEEVDSNECRMLLQVHDSITFEVRTEMVEAYVPRIRRVMEDVAGVIGFDPGVRFSVDITPWSAVEAVKHPDTVWAA